MDNLPYRPRLDESEAKWLVERRKNEEKNVVGVIGDTHEPFCIDGYFEFCAETFERYGVNKVIHIGDIVDQHALSYHEKDPDGKSAGDELDEAIGKLQKWYDHFRNVEVCIGNHDELPTRKAKTHGLPKRYIRELEEVLEFPEDWRFIHSTVIDDIRYFHGTGRSGKYVYANWATDIRQSCVHGHVHSTAGIHYMASERDMIFGMAVGCGMDRHAYAAAYGKHMPKKPIISCGVVVDGTPHLEFMPL